MTDFAIWTPKFDGDAPPNWKAGMAAEFRWPDIEEWLPVSCVSWGEAYQYRVPAAAMGVEEIYAPTPFDYPTWAAQGRANADKLPDGVAEALGPERDWALAVWREAFHAVMGSDVFSEDDAAAAVIRTRCRPIGNNTVTDELVAALQGAMDILGRAESNASGNPEWINVGPRVAACREALTKAVQS